MDTVNLTVVRHRTGKWGIWLDGVEITKAVTRIEIESDAVSNQARVKLGMRVDSLSIIGDAAVTVIAESDKAVSDHQRAERKRINEVPEEWVPQDLTGNRPHPDEPPTPTVIYGA